MVGSIFLAIGILCLSTIAGWGVANTIIDICRSVRKKKDRKTYYIYGKAKKTDNKDIVNNLYTSARSGVDFIKSEYSLGNIVPGRVFSIQGKNYIILGVGLDLSSEDLNIELELFDPENTDSSLNLVFPIDVAEMCDNVIKEDKNNKEERTFGVIKDIQVFCNNQCVMDCSDCVLKRYGIKIKENES